MPESLETRLRKAREEANRLRNLIRGKTSKNLNNNARARRNSTRRRRNAPPVSNALKRLQAQMREALAKHNAKK
jgi:hypothetical protein